MKKTLRSLFFITLCILLITVSVFALGKDKDVIFQNSTLKALQEGVYDGTITIKELKKHGNFGVGTYDGLDGEMCELDGKFYQIRSDGVVYAVPDSMTSPFAAVTYFEADKTYELTQPLDFKQLQTYIEGVIPTKNIFYAVRIDGNFKYIKTRSVPKQSKPYPRLVEVTKNQPTFEFHDVKGTILGYWLPEYVNGVNMAGYHFHFLSGDKKAGGHLLECQMIDSKMSIDYTYQLNLVLPAKSDFYNTDLSKDTRKELENIEK